MNVSSLQLDARERTKAEAIEYVAALLNEVRGSDLVLLPELWPSGYFSFDRYRADSEPIDGPLVKMLRDRAATNRYYLFTGSFVERDGDRLHNTSLLLGPTGNILGRYRKMHLFGYQSEERRLLTAGTDIVVLPTPWGLAGLSTCYDLRFPEMYRAMLDRGAEMFLVTAAWPDARQEAWTLFNRSRAHENLSHLFSCNFAGEGRGKKFAGHSLCVDPTGTIIADGGTKPCILRHEVQIEKTAAVRKEFPAIQDRVMRHPPRVPITKEHLEFFTLNLSGTWETPAGYPEGIQQKILAGALDEAGRHGTRSRLLRFAPGAFTTVPFEHEYWEEVFLVSGSLTVGGETFCPFTYACRPPHVPHGPFRSDEGCLLFELHYFDS